jgi:hypothetical protein
MCFQVKPVVRSHLIPTALYALCAPEGESPIKVANGVVMPTDRQTWTYLLCEECEDNLNSGGETWTIPKVATLEGRFPLYELLESQPPVWCDGDEVIYSARTNPAIDVEKITHFAIGIFWKASVASWKSDNKEPMINLGPYADHLRGWLTGETAFPRHICLSVSVSKPGEALITLNAPVRTVFKDCPTYLLHVPGVLFLLSVGRRVSIEMRMTCFHESPDRPIFVSKNIIGQYGGMLGAQFRDSRKTMAYLKAMAKRRKRLTDTSKPA